MRQKSPRGELPLGHGGEALKERPSGEALTAVSANGHPGDGHLMEEVVECGNIKVALKHRRDARGSAGLLAGGKLGRKHLSMR